MAHRKTRTPVKLTKRGVKLRSWSRRQLEELAGGVVGFGGPTKMGRVAV